MNNIKSEFRFLLFSLTVTYGTNSTLIQYLNIIACLCTNSTYCDYDQTTAISDYYSLASCTCPYEYDGITVKNKLYKLFHDFYRSFL